MLIKVELRSKQVDGRTGAGYRPTNAKSDVLGGVETKSDGSSDGVRRGASRAGVQARPRGRLGCSCEIAGAEASGFCHVYALTARDVQAADACRPRRGVVFAPDFEHRLCAPASFLVLLTQRINPGARRWVGGSHILLATVTTRDRRGGHELGGSRPRPVNEAAQVAPQCMFSAPGVMQYVRRQSSAASSVSWPFGMRAMLVLSSSLSDSVTGLPSTQS